MHYAVHTIAGCKAPHLCCTMLAMLPFWMLLCCAVHCYAGCSQLTNAIACSNRQHHAQKLLEKNGIDRKPSSSWPMPSFWGDEKTKWDLSITGCYRVGRLDKEGGGGGDQALHVRQLSSGKMWAYLACIQSWMLVVQTPVAKSNSSKVRKCIGTKKSSQQYGIACRHKHVITHSMISSSIT